MSLLSASTEKESAKGGCVSRKATASDDDYTRCLGYSEMVKIFKPLIVQNLLVHDILPSLPFLENHEDIYADMKNHSPKKAVVSLLDELERSTELGKWHKFIDALYANGYTYIVDNIRGYRFINHAYQREYIKKLTPKIGKMIVPSELMPHLIAKNLLSDSDKENIQREEINHGNFAAAVVLLGRIHRKHRNWYVVFIEALNDAKMEEVAADLNIPELLDNKRMKLIDLTKNEHYATLPESLANRRKSVEYYNRYLPEDSYDEYDSEVETVDGNDLDTANKDRHQLKSYVGESKSLWIELNQMRSRRDKIRHEVTLLEQKSSLITEINHCMSKKRNLLCEIAFKEKESEELKTDSEEEVNLDYVAFDNVEYVNQVYGTQTTTRL